MDKRRELEEELNYVSDYASVDLVFEVESTDDPNTGIVICRNYFNESASSVVLHQVVDINWCYGNVRRLADHTTREKMLHAVRASDPEIKAVSSKHPG